jgi:PHP family Zn ribbon phosphoesterase
VCLAPPETKKYGGICPVCGRPLTVGVLNRVEELADREEGFLPENRIPFKSLVPLNEIIADVLGTGVASKIVEIEYDNLIRRIGSEFGILLDASENDLNSSTKQDIAQGIIKVRQNKVSKTPGYDGVYGRISVLGGGKDFSVSQKTLFQ